MGQLLRIRDNRRISRTGGRMKPIIKITFEDTGQDFLEWYVRDGIVIDCQPFQGYVWVGRRVKIDGTNRVLVLAQKGENAGLRELVEPTWLGLRHRIERLDTLDPEEAELVEGYGRMWAENLKIPMARLGL